LDWAGKKLTHVQLRKYHLRTSKARRWADGSVRDWGTFTNGIITYGRYNLILRAVGATVEIFGEWKSMVRDCGIIRPLVGLAGNDRRTWDDCLNCCVVSGRISRSRRLGHSSSSCGAPLIPVDEVIRLAALKPNLRW